MRYNDIIKNLQNLTDREIKQVELAKATGITRATMNYRKKYNIEFSYDDVRKIEQYFNIMFENTKEKTISILYYPDIYASCGNGVLAQSENCQKINVPLSVFFTKVYDNKTYFVINAYGNSMCPFIEDNDKLIVEQYENEQIKDNRVYLFSFDNEIFIKRLVKNVNQLVIMSDNKEFDIIKLSGEDINKVNILGQVVGIMRDAR